MSLSAEIPAELLAKAAQLQIKTSDLTEQFIRGSGKGGQKINKTSSCVLLRHLPSGLEVRCQKHREQSKNRLSAFKLLLLKIENLQKGKDSLLAKKIFKLKKQKQKRSKRAKEKMLQDKKKHSEIKANRGKLT